jgi:hypothetical protein
MPNCNTPHSKKLRAKTSAAHTKKRKTLGYRYAKVPIIPENVKKWDSLKNKSEFINNAIAKIDVF